MRLAVGMLTFTIFLSGNVHCQDRILQKSGEVLEVKQMKMNHSDIEVVTDTDEKLKLKYQDVVSYFSPDSGIEYFLTLDRDPHFNALNGSSLYHFVRKTTEGTISIYEDTDVYGYHPITLFRRNGCNPRNLRCRPCPA